MWCLLLSFRVFFSGPKLIDNPVEEEVREQVKIYRKNSKSSGPEQLHKGW